MVNTMTVEANRRAGAAIRGARQRSGLSLRRLAALLEVSPATVSAVENGRTGVSVERLHRIADVLGVAPADLLEDLDPQTPQITPLTPALSPADPAGPPGHWRDFAPLPIDTVLAGAIRAFVETGYHGASMRSIARHAGMSVPGVYHYYPRKQDLLVAILDITMRDLIWRVEQARDEADDPLDRLGRVVEALALYHARRNELAFIGASEMRSLEPASYRRIARLRHHVQDVLDQQIEAAVAARAVSPRHPRDAGKAIATMCTSLAQWFRPDGATTPEQIAREYAELAVSMLGARLPG